MVIRREYLDRVRKKSFWIGVLVFPLIMGAMMILPALLAGRETEEQRRIAVVDATGKLVQPLEQELADDTLKSGELRYLIEAVPLEGTIEQTRKKLEPEATAGKFYGIITIEEDLYGKDSFGFYGKNVGNFIATQKLERALEKAVIGVRMEQMKLAIDRASFDRLTSKIDLEAVQISATGELKKKDPMVSYLGTFAFVIVLFMSVLLYGIAVMRGILEEKSNRIMEVLLGSLTPDQLMSGKIIGIGLVGLTQMAVYVVTSVGIYAYTASKKLEGDSAALLDMLAPGKMIYLVIFFILGYFMYTALFASIGAVCNSEQEAQNLQAPVQYMLMIPMITTIYFVKNPESTIAVVVSMIPIFTPMVMFMRISLVTPPFWQIALSIGLMLATIYLFFRGAAKVFRIGVLMYGKRPTIPEIFRWARS